MNMPMLLVLLGSTVLAAPASAQSNSDEGSVAVSGTVAGLCVLGAPSRASVDLGTLIATSGSRIGRIRVIGDERVSLPASFCNFAGTVLSVSTEALRTEGSIGVQSGFSRAVNYRSTVSNWAGQNAVVTTEASADGGTPVATGAGGYQPDPKIADLELTMSAFSVPADSLLIAGDYAGTVTITLGPAVGATD